jgi:hypothetical protein
MQSCWMLKQVVHIVTTTLYRINLNPSSPSRFPRTGGRDISPHDVFIWCTYWRQLCKQGSLSPLHVLRATSDATQDTVKKITIIHFPVRTFHGYFSRTWHFGVLVAFCVFLPLLTLKCIILCIGTNKPSPPRSTRHLIRSHFSSFILIDTTCCSVLLRPAHMSALVASLFFFFSRLPSTAQANTSRNPSLNFRISVYKGFSSKLITIKLTLWSTKLI